MKNTTKQTDKEVKKEKPIKAPARAGKSEKLDGENETGLPVEKPKKKKGLGIVALKHSRVINRVGKKDGKGRRKSLYQAMIDDGYSEEYARGGHIKNKKTFQKLLQERLGDDKLSNIHRQLLVSKKLDYMLFTHEIKDADIYELMESVGCTPKKIIHGIQGTHVWFWLPDSKSRKDALEMAYKLRGDFAAEKIAVEGGLSAMSDADLADLIKSQKKRFLKKD